MLDLRETMLVSVESTDKFDNSTLSVSSERTIEASLYQLLHRTRANEPLRRVRSYGKRNMSHANFAHAALISERDRAKDVEQLDDILRTFINETNKPENRHTKTSDEEKMHPQSIHSPANKTEES